MHCPVTRKRSFESREIAEEALRHHHTRQFHADDQGPVNVYECDHCGQWHFTSKGPVHQLLQDASFKDHMKREREAFHWERRLRR